MSELKKTTGVKTSSAPKATSQSSPTGGTQTKSTAAKAAAKTEEEKPYATLTIKFFKKKGFEVEGEHIETLAPGRVHRIMPGVYREMRRIRGKFVFDTRQPEWAARKKAFQEQRQRKEHEDPPKKERIRDIV